MRVSAAIVDRIVNYLVWRTSPPSFRGRAQLWVGSHGAAISSFGQEVPADSSSYIMNQRKKSNNCYFFGYWWRKILLLYVFKAIGSPGRRRLIACSVTVTQLRHRDNAIKQALIFFHAFSASIVFCPQMWWFNRAQSLMPVFRPQSLKGADLIGLGALLGCLNDARTLTPATLQC